MPKKVMTVLGPISPDSLGFTTMHEHVMMDGGWVLLKQQEKQGLPPYVDDRYTKDDPLSLENVAIIRRHFSSNLDALSLEDEEMMLGEVQDYKKSGGRTILEVSVPGIRHKVAAIKEISRKSGVNIIVSTGLYTGNSWPQKYLAMTDQELQTYMLNEIKYGVWDTGILPGHIKIAIGELSYNEERALRAAAQVCNQTGFSLTVHCEYQIGADGRTVARILQEEQMDISRAVIAHAARFAPNDFRLLSLHPELMKMDLSYPKELMDSGINISPEFENITSKPDWLMFGAIIALVKQGYSKQIVLGTDTCAKIHTRRGGGEGYCLLTRHVIPTLRGLGVSDYDIRMMTEKNPARILAY